MLCALFGLLVASVAWALLGPAHELAAGLIGAASAAGLFLALRYWPSKSQKK
ncbi:hypothetical protein [Magnetovibrio sp.]|uniref:hypothetical protein n=1 Tax=Magnetovibrio sp. TaxID=2024836 RepID=UPI002F94D631